MPNQPPGRRTESLFDNRYRYDYIYPRGRSGETLRAYDTHDNDRPVVIKRPAPHDAPPMRAGQEVSIRTEKQALERLSGHPVLVELRGSGTFRVGGHTHEYIVMDMAEGQIVEDMVLESAAKGQFLPELEILVIVDRLLDLLGHAHDKQVVYNDVDAKHLFWDRDTYQLKVIDWGNAVFLDEPGALPTVTRSTDIYQVGELLYFIFTGGNRLATEMDEEGGQFYVQFGQNTEHISPRLQAIITRAVHPDPRRRFGTIMELRHALAEYRQPLQKARDDVVSRVRRRVRPTASQEELHALGEELSAAFELDPGFPDAVALGNEIQQFIRQIQVQADLDAIRIYLESGNWSRALSLLNDLLPEADPTHEPLIRFLIDASATLDNLSVAPPPTGFVQALNLLFEGNAPEAGHILLTTPEVRINAREAQWLLAEQLDTHLEDVTLLRPHVLKLRRLLESQPEVDDLLDAIEQIDSLLAGHPLRGLTGLRVIYEQVADVLTHLDVAADSLSLPEATKQAIQASAARARHAADKLSTELDNVGLLVYSDPTHAGECLHRAALIDPTSPHFAMLHDYFDEVHQAVEALQQFRPRQDGANLHEWFADVQQFLQPYLDDLPDKRLHATADAIHQTADNWVTIVNYLALGRRRPTIDLLRTAAEDIRPVNEHIAAWFGDLANRLPDIGFVEQLSPNEALAVELINGWRAWDRGDALAAAQAGRTAYGKARTDGERMAANRLVRLSELLDGWLRDGGLQDASRTDQTESQTLALLLSEEERERHRFAEQMPNTGVYLRTMERGIVAFMRQSSSAGWRALYLHYILRSALALQEDELDEAEFWRNAAQTCFEDARTHLVFQLLDRTLTGKRLVQNAQEALNAVVRPSDLSAVRSALNAPLAGEMLAGALQAIDLIEEALRSWSDGEFYAARLSLDHALEHIEPTIENAGLQIEPFVEWLVGLRDTAAELQQARLSIEEGALTTSPDPDPALAEALASIVTATLDTLGPDHAHQVRQWEDMYQAVLETYTTQRLVRREKLAAFDRHFASLFIARHPAYPLFRHWRALVEQLPPDEPEDDMIQLDEMDSDERAAAPAFLEEMPSETAPPEAATERPSGDWPWNRIIAAALLILIAAAAIAFLRGATDEDAPVQTRRPQPTVAIGTAPGVALRDTQVASALSPTVAAPTATVMLVEVSETPTTIPATDTPSPTATPPTLTATNTPQPTPEPTSSPTIAVTGTAIPTSVATAVPPTVASPAIPSATSSYNVLAALASLPSDAIPGEAGAFVPNDDGSWTLTTSGVAAQEILIEFSPELLSAMFQPGAANTLRRADAVLEMVSYNQSALSSGDVAFGLGAATTSNERTIGLVQYLDTNLISLGLNQNGRFRSSTQFPQQGNQFELSIRRTNETTLSFFVNDRLLGDSVFLFPQGEPITLSLFVAGRDVAITIRSFEIDFSPRDEIP